MMMILMRMTMRMRRMVKVPCEKGRRSKLYIMYKLVMMFDYNVEQNIIGLMMTMRPSEKGRTSKLYIGAKLLLAVGAGSW